MFLGIYFKKDIETKSDFKDVFDRFSLNGTTKVEKKEEKKTILASYNNCCDKSVLYEDRQKKKILVFAGEIYGYEASMALLEKKGYPCSCLGEFLLNAWEVHGEAFLRELNGCFSLAIYDILKEEMTLINDHFGIFPVFIYNTEDIFLFSNDYNFILEYQNFIPSLDFDAIAEYFVFGLPLKEKTFYKNIENLKPGSLLKIHKETILYKKYIDLKIEIERDKGIDYFAEKIASRIKNSVNLRSENPNPIITLTGGVDTRLIVSNLSLAQREKIHFFTHYGSDLDETKDVDCVIAKKIAQSCNLHYTALKLERPDISKDFFAYIKNEKKEQRLLTGMYGGEFLGGAVLDVMPVQEGSLTRQEVTTRLKDIFSREFLAKISDIYSTFIEASENIEAENRNFLFGIQQLTRGFFTNIYGGSKAYLWIMPWKMNTLINTVFLDTLLLKDLLSVPQIYLQNYTLYTYIYKKYFPEFLSIETNNEFFALNKDISTPYIKKGVEPKHYTKKRIETLYRELFEIYRDDVNIDKNFYNLQIFREKKLERGKEAIKEVIKNIYRNSKGFQLLKESIFFPILKTLKQKRSEKRKNKGNLDFVSSFIDFTTWQRCHR